VISFFHETKIPTMNMKVHEYSKFRRRKKLKKKNSPCSMRDGSFHPSKCRDKVPKMGVL
jgi:hypothetical protein